MSHLKIFSALLTLLFACSCEVDPEMDEPTDQTTFDPYDPAPYVFDLPTYNSDALNKLPTDLNIPEDNPMTLEGVDLGRHLFYDPILSKDSTQSCSSCHAQANAFSDPRRFSQGIEGTFGTRNSMTLVNLVFSNRFTWDGAHESIESQSLEPVPNPIEMNLAWELAIERLKAHPEYPEKMWKAFNKVDFDKNDAAKALAQFIRSIVSVNSLFDRAVPGGAFLNDDNVEGDELEGFELFSFDDGRLDDPECLHCHPINNLLFTDDVFHNNGLEKAFAPSEFPDAGLGLVTEGNEDFGLFKTPTLRNIALTAPYMHDGRFETLEEVLDHYSDHLQASYNIDPLLGSKLQAGRDGVGLDDQEKTDIIAFLHTLTDTVLINNPAYSNPFK